MALITASRDGPQGSAAVLQRPARGDHELRRADRHRVVLRLDLIGGGSNAAEPARIPVAIVDQDDSAISKAIVAERARPTRISTVTVATADEARDAVRDGDDHRRRRHPDRFGEAAGQAFFGGGAKPELAVLYDPSQARELAMVRGILTQHVMQAVSAASVRRRPGPALVDAALRAARARATMPADQKRLLRDMLQSVQQLLQRSPAPQRRTAPRAGGITMPYTVREEAVTAGSTCRTTATRTRSPAWASSSCCSPAPNLGIEMLLERQRGLWKRLRSAPISRSRCSPARRVERRRSISLMTLLVVVRLRDARLQRPHPGQRRSASVGVAIACR